MRLDIITIFPTIFEGFLGTSILRRAIERQVVQINVVNLRNFTHDRHRTVDDRPYGGGAGMVMKPEPIFDAIDSVRTEKSHVILLCPQGEVFNQAKAVALTNYTHLILICGHYEGVDERVRLGLTNEEISIGDYILTNGNLAATVVTDAIVRLLPGALGCADSILEESFSNGMLEYPHYTRPETYRNMRVPDVLLKGNHDLIQQWRVEQAELRTLKRRPDLFKSKEVIN